jgi:gliding motility-associated-like protein
MNFSSKISVLITLLLTNTFPSIGQTYFANGTATTLGDGCFQFTSATNWQLASVWYADKLDLTTNFDLEFELNFGAKDVGADGIVFVLQTNGNKAIGLPGGGLGFEGFSPSLGVEFDDWNNVDLGDLASDHIAILKNGSVNHFGSNSLASPVPAIPDGGNIEDGQNHLVRITWNAATQLFEVWFDCVKRQRLTFDIVNTIFGGESEVFWGFTSSTGGENNIQVACLRDDILTSDTVYICQGESQELNVRESENNEYFWSPNIYLDDNTIKNPVCKPTISTIYYVDYTDQCGNKLRDTIHVRVENKPDLTDLNDVSLCPDEKLTITLSNTYGTVLWNGLEVGESFDLLNYEGELTVTSTNTCGVDSTRVNVKIDDCTCDMWFPNIVTLNSDGLNEDFGPIDACVQAKEYVLKVYNRWGEKLFETNDINENWDGDHRMNKVVDGVYFWVASWNLVKNGKNVPTVMSGTVDVVH